MRKRMKLTGVALAAALAFAATGCHAETKETETETTAAAAEETTAFPEASDAKESGETEDTMTEETESDRYVDENPIMEFGTIVSVDKEAGQILFLPQSDETPGAETEDGADSETETAAEDSGELILNVLPEGGAAAETDAAMQAPIIDAVSGLPVALSELKEGEYAYIWKAQMTTMSLPPQSPLQAMVVNIPEDGIAPRYVVVKAIEKQEDGSLVLTDQDGNKWSAAPEGTEITPYLTRQKVTLSDIKEGDLCMIWAGDTMTGSETPVYGADKIMLFAR